MEILVQILVLEEGLSEGRVGNWVGRELLGPKLVNGLRPQDRQLGGGEERSLLRRKRLLEVGEAFEVFEVCLGGFASVHIERVHLAHILLEGVVLDFRLQGDILDVQVGDGDLPLYLLPRRQLVIFLLRVGVLPILVILQGFQTGHRLLLVVGSLHPLQRRGVHQLLFHIFY
eukprot:CAMPEP_0170550090 /NCGR_PEP_ID=MMETSP0211-20121228/8135_1 /TAXON_ID=311385 /ORGANISM="Pseudokeronopsis sp., Strain OXSARD2" /LENGTH=171 /DNA_ID=CAMNT_0010856399 /DNA_START=405 /DNA_END=920 /DNA_ORIENTATION=+